MVHSVPTITQIYTILAGSQELQDLMLADLGPGEDEDKKSYAGPDPGLLGFSGSIQLPHLQRFCLHRVPFALVDFLTSSVSAPSCRSYNVRDILPLPSNRLQVAQNIAPLLQSCTPVRLVILHESRAFIKNGPQVIPGGWGFEEEDQQGCVLIFRGELVPTYLEDLILWLTAIPIPDLRMDLRSSRSNLPQDLFDRLPTLKTLLVDKIYNGLPSYATWPNGRTTGHSVVLI